MLDKGLDLVEKLPAYDNYRSIANNRRKKMSKLSHLVYTDLNKVEIPPAYNDFVLGEYNDNKNNRILIFASNEARELIKVGKTFIADGTFKRCPRPFKQLYVIFCDLGSSSNENNVVPVIYALMPNKLKKNIFIIIRYH